MAQPRCPHCLLVIPDARADGAGPTKCPHCGATLRLKAQAPRPAAVGELLGADVVEDDKPTGGRTTRRGPKKKRRGGKKDKKPAGVLRHLPQLAIGGGVAFVAGVVITLMIVLGKGGGEGVGG